MTTSVLPLYRVAIFAPGRQGDEELRASFIARQALLALILEDVVSTRPRGIPQHHLILGQRGMGKTTLLRRLDLALREGTLKERFIPLSFPEEQYAVDRLSALWLNCLDSFADTLEKEGAPPAMIARVDDLVEDLRRDTAQEPLLAERAEKDLLTLAEETGRRPVLLIDNLDLVFGRLTTAELHRLRAFLMKATAPILVGASISAPASTQDYRAPLYDQFKPHHLTRLSLAEMREVLIRLAEVSNNADVASRMHGEVGRLRALHALTGGNPRTTVILFQIFARGFSADAYQDLEALLDWMTPAYKARFEELADQAQVIVSTIASIWEPATSARIGERARLHNSQVSSQLDRLKKAGIVEEVIVDPDDRIGPLPSTPTPQDRTGYQLTERFFNIWFLMRQATRRDKRNLVFLTRFIECLHTPDERDLLASALLKHRVLSRAQRIYGLALESAVPTPALRYELHDHVENEWIEAKRRLQERIEELIDPTEIPEHKWAFAELRDRLVARVPADAACTGEQFAQAILGSPAMLARREAIAATPLDEHKLRELTEAAAEEERELIKKHGSDAVSWLQKLLRNGTLADPSDAAQASEAFKRADSAAKVEVCLAVCTGEATHHLSDEAWMGVKSLMQPKTTEDAGTWLEWADLSLRAFGRYLDAEAALQTAIIIDESNQPSWFWLGYLFDVHLDRPKDAMRAYRRSLELKETTWAWNNLSILLDDECRHEESEQGYKRAIELDPTNVLARLNLARMYRFNLNRYAEAERVLRDCLDIAPSNSEAWNLLGDLFYFDLDRAPEAEEAYRRAAELAPLDARTWHGLAYVLHHHQDQFAEAEACYRKSLEQDRDAVTLNNLGLLLGDNLGRIAEAIEAFYEAIRLDPTDKLYAPYNLVSLLRDHTDRREEAERRAAELPSSDVPTLRAGLLLHPAAFAAYDDNWGVARQHLGNALDLIANLNAFPADTYPTWMRTTAVFVHLGFGERLLELLRTRGDDQRLRPWYEAIRALQRGDRRYLRNAPAEVQDSAGRLYDHIARYLQFLPESTRRWPVSKPKTVRRTRLRETPRSRARVAPAPVAADAPRSNRRTPRKKAIKRTKASD